MVDENTFATEELVADKPNEFFDRNYPIPFHLTKGKTKVTIKLRAHSGNKAGGIFFARTLMKAEK